MGKSLRDFIFDEIRKVKICSDLKDICADRKITQPLVSQLLLIDTGDRTRSYNIMLFETLHPFTPIEVVNPMVVAEVQAILALLPHALRSTAIRLTMICSKLVLVSCCLIGQGVFKDIITLRTNIYSNAGTSSYSIINVTRLGFLTNWRLKRKADIYTQFHL